LLLGGVAEQVARDQIGVQGEADAAGPDPGQLLLQDDVVAEVADPAAAELLGDHEAEQSELAGAQPQLARHDAVGLPLRVVRHDLLLQEGAHRVAEGVALGLEQGALHQSSWCSNAARSAIRSATSSIPHAARASRVLAPAASGPRRIAVGVAENRGAGAGWVSPPSVT